MRADRVALSGPVVLWCRECGGGAAVIAAIAVFLVGAGLTALGLVEPTMYDIGIMVMFLGSIGVVVRAVELTRWLWR